MIYEDIYDYMLRKVSSKEIDILLLLANQVDWGSIVRVDNYQLAKEAGTTIKYVKSVLKKFTSHLTDKRVLKKVAEDTYIFLKGKSNVLHHKSDIYCKKFEFLYGDTFQELSVYGKRILLTAAMRFSLTGQREAYLPVSDFIFRNNLTSGLVPSRSVLVSEINKINALYGLTMTVGVTSVLSKRVEYIYIEVREDLLEDVRNNHAERGYLRKVLFESGYAGYLTDDYCIEIEKVGKHIFNYLVVESKGYAETYNGDYTREMMDVAREIYATSIKRIAKQLHKLINKGEEASAISAYFSSIVFSVLLEETAVNKNKKSVIERVISRLTRVEKEAEYEMRVKNVDILLTILDAWCFKWVLTRFKEEGETTEDTKKNIARNYGLKASVQAIVSELANKIEEYGNRKDGKIRGWLRKYEETVENFIDMKNDRMALTT